MQVTPSRAKCTARISPQPFVVDRSHLERPHCLPESIVHMTHVAVRAREHVASVAADGTLELVEDAVVVVQIAELRRKRSDSSSWVA